MTLTALQGVTYDSTGRRIPVLHFLKDDDQCVMKVVAYPQGLQFEQKAPLPQEVVNAFVDGLLQFIDVTDHLSVPPEPREHPPVVKRSHKKKGGSGKKPTSVSKKPQPQHPHPSHYPAKVFEGAPPEAPPGGWPKGAGVWEDVVRNPRRDEYGPKGGIVELPDQPGRPTT